MFVLVCFDISDNRVRYRVNKVLQGYGVRVQKSVYECPLLGDAAFRRMRSAIEKHIHAHTDSVRYYRLCAACIREIRCDGSGMVPDVDSFAVV
ncbi:CRISPR-associated endonuclease Cas2 [Desulfobotulus alkaliphilus]|nr:CRISPR-associated endonuclease Cas2 [Desulfobotulus alkaliphilus]